MKDTLRILVSWTCNLKCTYCCNEQERFRKDIIPTAFEDIKWGDYSNFCVTGGEPLMHMPLVEKVCRKIPAGKVVILYSNGIMMDRFSAMDLQTWGVRYINVGLHTPASFGPIIQKVTNATFGMRLGVRFHAQDIYEKDLTARFPHTSFRFWKMNDCDRDNEDRIVLKESC